MKKLLLPLRFAGVLVTVSVMLLVLSCKPEKEKVFTGMVTDLANNPISKAAVTIQGKTTMTGPKGEFKIKLTRKDTLPPYLVSARKFGYGLFSRSFYTVFTERKIILNEGTVSKGKADQPVLAKDTRISSNCSKPPLASIDVESLKRIVPRVYDQKGTLVDVGIPDEFQKLFQIVRDNQTCNPGAQVLIPAKAIGSSRTKPFKGDFKVAVTTVDLYNPDGMPGDFTAMSGNERVFMETFGAVTVDIQSEKGDSLYLLDGQEAIVTVPVDPLVLKTSSVPDSIPLLFYDEKTDLWNQEGFAKLNESKDAFVGKVGHFSTMNMDMLRTNPSCVQVRQIPGTAYLPSYKVEILVAARTTSPTNPFKTKELTTLESPATCAWIGGAQPTQTHAFFNLPNNANVGLIFKDLAGKVIDINFITTSPATTLAAGVPPCGQPDCDACSSSSTDPCSMTCGYQQCSYVKFDNPGPAFEAVAIPMGGGKVRLKWAYTGTATSFSVFRCTDPADCPDSCGGTAVNTTTTSADMTGLTAGTQYTFNIVAGSTNFCVGPVTAL